MVCGVFWKKLHPLGGSGSQWGHGHSLPMAEILISNLFQKQYHFCLKVGLMKASPKLH